MLLHGQEKHIDNGGRNGYAQVSVRNLPGSGISDATISDYLKKLNTQSTFHFSKDWPFITCILNNNPGPSDWVIDIAAGDGSGYHTVGGGGEPYGYVTTSANRAWENVMAHEVFEMAANPYVDRKSNWFWGGSVPNIKYDVWHEVCDQVNGLPLFGNTFGGKAHHDYVLAYWFASTSGFQPKYVTRAQSDSLGPDEIHQPGWLHPTFGYIYLENSSTGEVEIITSTGAAALGIWTNDQVSELPVPKDCFWTGSEGEPKQLLRAQSCADFIINHPDPLEVQHISNRLTRAGRSDELPRKDLVKSFNR